MIHISQYDSTIVIENPNTDIEKLEERINSMFPVDDDIVLDVSERIIGRMLMSATIVKETFNQPLYKVNTCVCVLDKMYKRCEISRRQYMRAFAYLKYHKLKLTGYWTPICDIKWENGGRNIDPRLWQSISHMNRVHVNTTWFDVACSTKCLNAYEPWKKRVQKIIAEHISMDPASIVIQYMFDLGYSRMLDIGAICSKCIYNMTDNNYCVYQTVQNRMNMTGQITPSFY